jgi:hypothetical protein
MSTTDNPIYDALALPNEALANGGVEILRAGIIDDELYVTARRAFSDPAKWGDALADIARRIALLYSAEDTDLKEKEILTDIMEAFLADLGAPVVKERKAPRKTGARKAARRSSAAPRRKARATTRKSVAARKASRRKKR